MSEIEIIDAPQGKKTYRRASFKRKIGKDTSAKKKRTQRRTKPKSVSWYKKEADRVCSLWVRQSNADENGNVSCYTCGYTTHWKKIQNGHFVSRYYLATRYDPRNLRPQCITCNMWRNGMTPDFSEKLKEELGAGIVEELYALARQETKSTKEFYEKWIEHYKSLL